MKKIAFITDKVYPYFIGGQEKRIFEYSKILKNLDQFEVSIVSMKWWQDSEKFVKNINYISICSQSQIYKKNGKRNILSSMRFGIATFFYVLKSDDDILDIEIFPYFPVISARLASIFKRKKPIIVGYWAEYWGKEYWHEYYGFFWFIGVFLEKISYISCDKIIANSYFTQDKLQWAFGKDKEKIMTIFPISVDIDRINKVSNQYKKYDIIYYGRIIAHKHVEHIIDIVKRIKLDNHNIKALIIGEGPDDKIIKEKILSDKLSENIEFINFIDDYDVLISRIKSAKLMIQLSEREGFGITVIESNACGVPVLIIDYPDNAAKELINNDENGFVCKDVEDVYKKSNLLLFGESNEMLNEMSQNSVRIVQKYSYERMQKIIQKYYINL
ncbi:MAG: glycosyltransferase family 4 protein [Candidatus Moraniibacteriota bacterium]|jgi:glycosyltransferase involved in cell wall biosynthesis